MNIFFLPFNIMFGAPKMLLNYINIISMPRKYFLKCKKHIAKQAAGRAIAAFRLLRPAAVCIGRGKGIGIGPLLAQDVLAQYNSRESTSFGMATLTEAENSATTK